jgi:hypothetical protein
VLLSITVVVLVSDELLLTILSILRQVGVSPKTRLH